jgi:hypothetical protein
MLRRKLVALALFVCCSSTAALLVTAAHAQKTDTAKPRKLDLEALRKDLESGDDERIVPALEKVRDAGPAARPLAPQIDALLRRGITAKSCVPALDAAAALALPSLSAALAPYVRHRTPAVRRSATHALVKSSGPDAVQALRVALRSNDPVVRATAASGLGEIGAKEAIGDLFAALQHGVNESAASIGRLCEPTSCDKLLALLGNTPFAVVTAGVDPVLFRASTEISDDYKVRVIERIAALGTAEAASYLVDVAQRWPKRGSKRVKQALDAAVKATGGPKAKQSGS